MKKLTPKEIHDKFNANVGKENDFTRALATLSSGLNDLREAGIDVQMHLFGVCTESAFDLKPENASSWWMMTSGILRIGGSEHLVAYVTAIKPEGAEEKKSCNLLLVSELDIRYQGTHTKIRTKTFNLAKNGAGVAGLQNFIIDIANTQTTIAAADKHGVLQNRRPESSVFTVPLILGATRRIPTK